MFAHIVIALGAAAMVVKRDARANDVDKGGTTMPNRTLDERHQLFFVARKAAADIGCTEL